MVSPVPAVITGTVEAGPIYPLIIAGKPKTRAVAGAVVEVLYGRHPAAVCTTDDLGRYEVTLSYGTYLIRAMGKGLYSAEPGKTVTVAAGDRLTVNFILDTGRRSRRNRPG